MKANLTNIKKLDSSFLSIEKDFEEMIKILFVQNQPHSDELKRLMVINTKDCMDRTNAYYDKLVRETTVAKLKENGYVRTDTRTVYPEHENVKSYITFALEKVQPNKKNSQYRDVTITIDILSHCDYMDIGNFQLRPVKIAGYIDALLDGAKLSGIGTLQLVEMVPLRTATSYTGYLLRYKGIHGIDDKLPPEEE